MSIQHIMLLELSDEEGSQSLHNVIVKVQGLLESIPGVISVTSGENFSNRAPNVTHAAIITLTDKPALQAYATHPKHLEAQGLLKPFIRSAIAVDYES